MYRNLVKIPTLTMPKEEWLEERRQSIGGSDASGILRLNKFSSPYTVWADKRGLLPEKEDNEAMRQGRDLEDYVARRFMEKTGKKVRRENYMLRNPDFPFAHADVDRVIVGEDAGLECKTTKSLTFSKFKNGEFPTYYYVQCVHYLMVTGCQRWYLAVLVLGEGFYVFTIERDEEEIKALAEAEAEFWNEYVVKGVTPGVDGAEPTTEAVNAVYNKCSGGSVGLLGFDSDLEKYIEINEKIKELNAMKDEVANKIKCHLAEADEGESEKFKVTWKPQSRSKIDVERLAKDYPSIDLARYMTFTNNRTFRVRKVS